MLEKQVTTERKKLTFGLKSLITIIGIAIVILGMIFILRLFGKNNLSKAVAGDAKVEVGQVTEDLQDNQIMFDGKRYQLNEDIVSVLVMGVDTETVKKVGGKSWSAKEGSYLAGGQADTLILVVINPHTKKVSFLAINRNTMADVDVWDEDGNYVGVFLEQIALQHGFGDGKEESCEHQVKAVSRLLCGIPINKYAAISMDAVPVLNDAVGGVNVTVLDDLVYPEYDMNMHKGDEVNLMGEKAYWYVRLRHEDEFNSNQLRLNRQKQYLTEFIKKAKEAATSDYRVALNIYKNVSDYMVTDVDVSTFTYMATEYLDYDFDVDNFYSLQGETMQGTQYEEFYADKKAIEKLVIDLFYEQVIY
ncbi:cell envelope-related function transcriptional attenuator common domain [Butyrivibrio fibrisolvens 16/4]|nr:cell envelope-related function transcriptional attenuator common domain [Butyrivibrio fibrisolvens 16/4]